METAMYQASLLLTKATVLVGGSYDGVMMVL